MNPRIVIIFAIFAIGIGVYGLLGKSEPKPAAQVAKAPVEEKIKVYTANSDLEKGQAITRDKVSIEWLSKSKANKKGIDKDAVLGFDAILLARKDIPQGEVIYPEFTIGPNDIEYVDFVTQPGYVPFPIEVDPTSLIGGVIHANSKIDILAMSSTAQNMATSENLSRRGFTSVTLTPILMSIKVIKVDKRSEEAKGNKKPVQKTSLILELTPKQVATITVAKKIAQLEVHKSIDGLDKQDLSADAGDVLENYKSIKEFRANNAKIN